MYFDEDIKIYEFKNDSHFNNHIDYLMRTDKVQKWTNEYTSKNESFTLGNPTDTGIFQFKLDTRKSLKENFYKQWKQDVNHLYFARVECPRDDIFDWNADMHKEMQKIVQDRCGSIIIRFLSSYTTISRMNTVISIWFWIILIQIVKKQRWQYCHLLYTE